MGEEVVGAVPSVVQYNTAAAVVSLMVIVCDVLYVPPGTLNAGVAVWLPLAEGEAAQPAIIRTPTSAMAATAGRPPTIFDRSCTHPPIKNSSQMTKRNSHTTSSSAMTVESTSSQRQLAEIFGSFFGEIIWGR
jgi:hypothetical protein